MSARRLEIILWSACLIVTLIGCSDGGLQRAMADPPHEIFDAVRATGVPGGSYIRINSAIPGDIQIVVYPGDEVALDYISTGWGDDMGKAAAEARKMIAVSLNVATLATGLKEITIDARFDSEQGPHHPKDSLVLHLRVPPRVRISVDALQATSSTLEVVGEVENVEAQVNKGDITVHGAIGDLHLSTQQGSIRADARGSRLDQPNKINLRTDHGNVELYSVSASVSAHADNGDIYFVGALAGGDNSFTATGAGKVIVAVPEDVPYRFYVQGGRQVVTDFASGTLVCGFIDGAASNSIDESFRTSDDSTGYISITHMITLTDYVSGMMTPQRYVFHTNRGTVAKYLPKMNAQSELDRALLPNVVQCREAVQPSTVGFRVAAQKGEVYVRLIRKLSDK
jgi:hypothetical protein